MQKIGGEMAGSHLTNTGTIQLKFGRPHPKGEKNAAQRSRNLTRKAGFKAKGAEAFAKGAKKIAFAFRCENLCVLCVKTEAYEQQGKEDRN
jgi:hypothetical protein